MSLLHIALIALVQGLTEWLPVSSSAHLILLSAATALPDQGVAIDALAHGGTLAALIVYFRADCASAMRGLGSLTRGDRISADARLALFLVLATPPALIAGLSLDLTGAADTVRSPYVIAMATIGFGLLLWIADALAPAQRTADSVGVRDAILLGLAQAVALIPGTSRSGIVVTAARICGFKRVDAARLAMLAGGPVLAAAAGYGVLKMLTSADGGTSLVAGMMVCLLSFVSGLASIWALMAVLRRMSYLPFVLYRLALGGALLLMAPAGGLLTTAS